MEKWEVGKAREVIHDPRGDITSVADGVFRSVMLIESKKGTVRANHWHKTDTHVMYIISGRARYYEETQSGGLVVKHMGPGDSVFTPSIVPHAMEFIEDTLMVVCATNARDYDAYMADTVKFTLVL